MSTLQIQPGKFYRTRNRRKARIYATDGSGDWCIHGAILVDGQWKPFFWKGDGAMSGSTDGPADLIAEWKDEPIVDWSKLPVEVKAVAMDATGEWFAYPAEPTRNHAGMWVNTGGKTGENLGNQYLFPSQRPQFTGNWKDSLVIRP